MVGFGHPSIADVWFRDPRHPVVGVRIVRLKEIYRRAGSARNRRHRLPVHLLALLTAGRASFIVDFASFRCRPGGLLWVRPGQFIGLPAPGVDATLVLFESDFPHDGDLAGRCGVDGTYWQPGGEDGEAIVDGVSQLEIDYHRIVAGDGIPTGVLRHQLAALLLRVTRLKPESLGPPRTGVDSELLARFRREIESRFAHTRQVDDYAATLACSVRSLTRASLAATGRTAKQLVDDRVALEAKRLLAESNLGVAEIAARLGFTEPTNFGRFFARTVGTSPGHFRAASRREAAESDLHRPAQPLAVAVAKAGANRD
jgi:AraC-like DNA-binding protein